MFDDILEKKAFVDYKNKQFLIFKNWDFSRGFFLWQNRAGKCL